MSSVKKTSYNVNSIIGKYIMPVIVAFRNDTILSISNKKGEKKPQTYAVIYTADISTDPIYKKLLSKIKIDRLKNRKTDIEYSQEKAEKMTRYYKFIKAFENCDEFQLEFCYEMYLKRKSLKEHYLDIIKSMKDTGYFNHNIYRWDKRQNITDRHCTVILMDEYIRQNILFRALVDKYNFGNKYYQAFARNDF
jgi:hypothetical protein